jgi:hypothetical protein
MKNKIIFLILTSLLLISAFMIVFIYDNNQKLNLVINEKDEMIDNITNRDSILAETTKEYSEVITKYVSADCEFQIEDKTYSAKEMIEMLNYYIVMNDTLKKAVQVSTETMKLAKNSILTYASKLQMYMDSTLYYKHTYRTAQKEYGINYDFKRTGKTIHIYSKFSKLDSALLLFPYYRNNLRHDTIAGRWIITVEKTTSSKRK